MIQRFVVVLLMQVVIFAGCGEDEPDKVKPKKAVDEGPKKRIIWEKDGARMALVPGGSFNMGRDNDAYSEEGPMHKVELDAFYMDVREVTVGKFKRFVEENGYAYNFFDGFDDWLPTDYHPMIFADWNDATAYCEWAGKRLPTEAEWEYAARGGLRGKLYSWGDDVSIARKYANYRGTGGKDKWADIAPVGNGYGLYDITGNA